MVDRELCNRYGWQLRDLAIECGLKQIPNHNPLERQSAAETWFQSRLSKITPSPYASWVATHDQTVRITLSPVVIVNVIFEPGGPIVKYTANTTSWVVDWEDTSITDPDKACVCFVSPPTKPDAGDRWFATGAKRDEDLTKLDFEGFLHPLVLKRFCEHMNRFRIMKDGSVRSTDNWQNLFGENHLDVCMKSAMRHVMDMWMEHRGIPSREGMEAAINGVLFNVMAYAYKWYLDHPNPDEVRDGRKDETKVAVG